MIPRSLHQLFEKIEAQVSSYTLIYMHYSYYRGTFAYVCILQNVSEFSIRVSFLELYNEELFDLLNPGDDSGSRLRIFEDSARKARTLYSVLS